MFQVGQRVSIQNGGGHLVGVIIERAHYQSKAVSTRWRVEWAPGLQTIEYEHTLKPFGDFWRAACSA